MEGDWLILHGGALGDLVLTIQLALRLPGVADRGILRVVSRVNPGNLSGCRPSIVRQSSEGLGLHWLFSDADDSPPKPLWELVRRTRVLNALAGPDTAVHRRLQALEPAAAYSFDPRPREGAARHITQQWQTQLEAQGLLVPKCVHQRPSRRGLGVPETLREGGAALLRAHLPAATADQSPKRKRGTDSAYGRYGARPLHCVCGGAVVIHPGSGGRDKCWPRRGFVEVARRLQHDHQAAVCFLVGPVELEQWPEREFAALAGEFPLLRCPEPDELVAILAAARAFVGNDAGPGHLAALLGTPTVTIFGPTSASVWRPLGPSAQVLVGDPVRHADDWGIHPDQVVSLVRG